VLVRIRAAALLGRVSISDLPAAQQDSVGKATDELIASFNARSDNFASHTSRRNLSF
jgi:hypothetical protein